MQFDNIKIGSNWHRQGKIIYMLNGTLNWTVGTPSLRSKPPFLLFYRFSLSLRIILLVASLLLFIPSTEPYTYCHYFSTYLFRRLSISFLFISLVNIIIKNLKFLSIDVLKMLIIFNITIMTPYIWLQKQSSKFITR